MALNIHQKSVSARFFTGNKRIEGLKKANWVNKGDNLGSETFRIVDEATLSQAVRFALKAYEISVDWYNSIFP
jgi:hypothetical protein